MVIMKIFGGLGNQMFQYAIGRCISVNLKTDLYLDIGDFAKQSKRKFELDYFNCKYKIAEDEVINNMRNDKFRIPKNVFYNISGWLPSIFKSKYIIENKSYKYDPSIRKLTGDIYLEGYWQSEKYFKEIRNILLKDFSYKKELDKEDRKLAKEMENTVSVSMHLRRADYITDAAASKHFELLNFEYYDKAIKEIKKSNKKIKIYVFSDDIEWVKENFKSKEEMCFIKRKEADNYLDMRMMSHCKHNIIANSSFSWWGAWLNQNKDKIVIAPKAWVKDLNTTTNDLVPETWIRI